MDLTTLLSGEGRTLKTIEMYAALLHRLHKRATSLGSMENLLWLNNVDAVSRSLEGYKPASRKVYLVPILILLRRGKHHDLTAKYHTLFVAAMHELTAQRKGLKQDETVLTPEITLADVFKKKRQFASPAKDLLAKQPGTLTSPEKRLLMQYLVLVLYTGMSQPLPFDMSAVSIARLGESISEITSDCLAEERIEKFTFYPKRTKKTGQRGEFSLPCAINKVVSESLKVFLRKFLLSNDAGGAKVTPGELRRLFSSMFLDEGTVMDFDAVLALFATDSGM
jgi:hypothetical protein